MTDRIVWPVSEVPFRADWHRREWIGRCRWWRDLSEAHSVLIDRMYYAAGSVQAFRPCNNLLLAIEERLNALR